MKRVRIGAGIMQADVRVRLVLIPIAQTPVLPRLPEEYG
jgi:hypothetical protein